MLGYAKITVKLSFIISLHLHPQNTYSVFIKRRRDKGFFLHGDSSFCFMIHRRSIAYARQRYKYLQFFPNREILQEEKKEQVFHTKKIMNVSTGTSANNTSSSYTPYSVPLRGEGITVSGAPNKKKVQNHLNIAVLNVF